MRQAKLAARAQKPSPTQLWAVALATMPSGDALLGGRTLLEHGLAVGGSLMQVGARELMLTDTSGHDTCGWCIQTQDRHRTRGARNMQQLYSGKRTHTTSLRVPHASRSTRAEMARSNNTRHNPLDLAMGIYCDRWARFPHPHGKLVLVACQLWGIVGQKVNWPLGRQLGHQFGDMKLTN